MNAAKLVVPAIIGGLVGGLPSVMPMISWFCIFWVILGGAVSAYLAKKSAGSEKFEVMDGVISGGLAGVLSSLVMVALLAVFSFFFGGLVVLMGALPMLFVQNLQSMLIFGVTSLVEIIVLVVAVACISLFYIVGFGTLGAIGGAIYSSVGDKSEKK